MYLLAFHAYILLGILIFIGLTGRRLYKSFGVKLLSKLIDNENLLFWLL
jgi:hypothetical protein